jgi:hypothetical protein
MQFEGVEKLQSPILLAVGSVQGKSSNSYHLHSSTSEFSQIASISDDLSVTTQQLPSLSVKPQDLSLHSQSTVDRLLIRSAEKIVSDSSSSILPKSSSESSSDIDNLFSSSSDLNFSLSDFSGSDFSLSIQSTAEAISALRRKCLETIEMIHEDQRQTQTSSGFSFI